MLTRKGVLEVLASIVLLFAGSVGGGIVLYLGGVGLIGILLVGRVRARARHVEVNVTQPAQHLVEEGTAATAVRFTNPGRLPVHAEFEYALPSSCRVDQGSPRGDVVLQSGAQESLEFVPRFPLRGEHQVGPVRLRFHDAFRNHVVEQEEGQAKTLSVFPRRLLLDDFSATSHFAAWLVGQHLVNTPGHGMDFFSLREYQPSDRIRDINWKASARRSPDHPPIVNQRTRESYAEVLVILDARASMGFGWETFNPLAQACRAVVTLLAWVHRRRDDFRLLVVQDDVQEVRPGNPDRQTADVTGLLTTLVPSGSLEFGSLLEGRLGRVPARAPVVIVTSLESDPSILEVVGNLRARGHQVSMLVPVPPFAANNDRPSEARLSEDGSRQLVGLRSRGARVVEWLPEEPLALAVAREAGA